MPRETFLDERVVLHSDDNRDVIRTFGDCTIDSLVADPPYALTSIVKRFGSDDAAPVKVPEGGSGAYRRAAAGFMGQKWDTGEVAHDVAFWRECWRVLKPGGYVVAFGGSRTYHRLASAIEDAGFEIRDSILDLVASDTRVVGFLESLSDEQRAAFVRCIDESRFGGLLHWVFGSGFPKSHDVSKAIDRAAGVEREVIAPPPYTRGKPTQQYSDTRKVSYDCEPQPITAPATDAAREWQGWGTALKPACEPIVLARKPLSEGTIAANVLTWGTGALNVDGCRVETDENLNGGAYAANGGREPMAGDQRVGAALGMFQPGKTTGAKFNQPQGRWPANLVHDGSEEVIAAFPASDGSISNRSSPKTAGIYGAMSGEGERWAGYADDGSAARFFYTAKADASDRLGSKHPTVKPVSLMQWLVRLVTPKGGLVLDPFAGTGTTAEACFREGARCILIERNANYCADIRRRMALVLAGPDERKRATVKAGVEKPFEEGSLFFGLNRGAP